VADARELKPVLKLIDELQAKAEELFDRYVVAFLQGGCKPAEVNAARALAASIRRRIRQQPQLSGQARQIPLQLQKEIVVWLDRWNTRDFAYSELGAQHGHQKGNHDGFNELHEIFWDDLRDVMWALGATRDRSRRRDRRLRALPSQPFFAYNAGVGKRAGWYD